MRNWERPMVVVDTFAANEFVSTCAEGGSTYKFQCNAGEEGHSYSVYYYDNYNRRHYLAGPLLTHYSKCGDTHEASTKDDFIDGYIDDQSTIHDEHTPVVIWTDRGRDVHCTTVLNKDSWARTPS